MTHDEALISILSQQRNAAMDGLAQVSAMVETLRVRVGELETENAPLKARVAELERQLHDFAGEQLR